MVPAQDSGWRRGMWVFLVPRRLSSLIPKSDCHLQRHTAAMVAMVPVAAEEKNPVRGPSLTLVLGRPLRCGFRINVLCCAVAASTGINSRALSGAL